jgi:hypothetical protein
MCSPASIKSSLCFKVLFAFVLEAERRGALVGLGHWYAAQSLLGFLLLEDALTASKPSSDTFDHGYTQTQSCLGLQKVCRPLEFCFRSSVWAGL